MLQGWHSGSHAPGRLRGLQAKEGTVGLSPHLALTMPPHTLNSGAGSVPAPQPCHGLVVPGRGAGGTDPVRRRFGESKSCPRRVPRMCWGQCPILPPRGPMGLGLLGGRRVPGDPLPKALHAGVRGGRELCRDVPVPRWWPDPGQGRAGTRRRGARGGYDNPVRDVLGNPPNPRLRRG